MKTNEIIKQLTERQEALNAEINAIQTKRDTYALSAVMGEEKAIRAIQEYDQKLIPLQNECRTVAVAIQQAEARARKEQRDAETAAKRAKRQEFNQLAARMMELSGQAAETLKTLKPILSELDKCARETWQYSNPESVQPLHLKGATNTVFERCLLISCGLNTLISTGPITTQNIKFAESPEHYFNAVIHSWLNRVNQAMAASTNDQPEEIAPLTIADQPTQEVKKYVAPKTNIKVVRVANGLDVVKADDPSEVIAQLVDEPTAFSEWFNSGAWPKVYQLVGDEYPLLDAEETPTSEASEAKHKAVHKGKGYWQIVAPDGSEVLPECVQGRDMIRLVAENMGIGLAE
ncbi:hypothetical protein VCSRO104_3615 [Vibrio cholerae]|uniref:hypothetical protein n=1 Tax=Vibrio cholerae TaxID=666 RepID=UPI0011D4BCE5|nr:hypothetical protein [Vibrio cholerae]TXY35557.1 hypothetical protein FXE83_05915 [Vibrio cholerae]GHW87328.1 hypothetical protein VCSRO104_3615 [Vibrio cholerae]